MYKMLPSTYKFSFTCFQFLWFDNEDKIRAKQQNFTDSGRLTLLQPACLWVQAGLIFLIVIL